MKKWEQFKTVLLTVLVGLSLLLTVALWNYQPKIEQLDPTTTYIHETQLSGKTQTKADIVQPMQIIYHKQGEFYGLKSTINQSFMYKEMLNWTLYDFHNVGDSTQMKDNGIEIIFPTKIPIQIIPEIFKSEEHPKLSSWSFDRMYITLNNQSTPESILFVTEDGQRKMEAKIQNGNLKEFIGRYIKNDTILTQYIMFGVNDNNPIYLPKGEVSLPKKTYPTSILSTQPLINVLFNDPSLVRQNLSNYGIIKYTDGSRRMNVSQNEHIMNFINPFTEDFKTVDREELINNSLDFMNDHLGWTDDYTLYDISESTNTIKFRLSMDGYPVFDNNQLSVIEQSWRDQEIYEYNRSLIHLTTPFESEGQKVVLPSGEEIKTFIEKYPQKYFPYLIGDIAIGYTIHEKSFILSLEPAWFIKYNGEWQEIKVEDMSKEMGGAK